MIEHPDHTGNSGNPAAPWNTEEMEVSCDECGHTTVSQLEDEECDECGEGTMNEQEPEEPCRCGDLCYC